MYVEDGKRTYRHIYTNNFLNIQPILQSAKSFGKLRLRTLTIPSNTVMLCMSKMSKMGKEHTDTFMLITFLIFNQFSIRKKFWKAET